jgi:hypothetical protein
MARTPSKINELDVDLNITVALSSGFNRAALVAPPRVPLPVDAQLGDASQHL